MTDTYNPTDFTVDEVNAYLADADDAERDRVLAAEADGKARKGILDGPDAHQEPDDDDRPNGIPNPTGTPEHIEVTKAELDEAAAVAAANDGETTTTTLEEATDKGYFGTSPQREATGLDDKGLSQASVLGDARDTSGVKPPQGITPPEGWYDANGARHEGPKPADETDTTQE